MCGLAGWIGGEIPKNVDLIAQSMTDAIHHRGPDDAGIWWDNEAGAVLGHRRLAILDLTAAGHQPMISPCGRFTLVYNGEIYNHQALRAQLEGGAAL